MTQDTRRRGERRCALVTGGNRGIGLALCRQLDAAGLRVILAVVMPTSLARPPAS